MSQCKAVLNIKGEHYSCDIEAPHTGWAHANEAAGALWCSAAEASRATKKEKVS